ncbi:DUF1989 domain-containing protein [Falsibacillus albus]|uniref:Urea carboxylase-associated family protein n=1 Tax=Falsibacillus albus TaxID=2478915 RepID=A0A3L7JT96_9BACI|nr:urea carboxylase-associated family protein [Falsibacillus albus]RLQ94063.1 urea carboxylase-associated family protein [Falsibacillus albus]
MKQEFFIEAEKGLAFTVKKGQIITVIDVEGEQVVDFVVYREGDVSERIDPGVTMDALHSYMVKPGDIIYSNKYRPIMSIVEDKVGRHDFFNPACRPEMYELLYNKENHRSCYENLNDAFTQYGVPKPDQHYPFNLFMNTVVKDDGTMSVERPVSKPGDYIKLKAEMDLIVGASACPCSESACNGYVCTPIKIVVE